MKTIPLSSVNRCKNYGLFSAIVDDADYEYLSQFSWASIVRRDAAGGVYVRARRKDKDTGVIVTVYMHREIWERSNGPVPIGGTIDHVEHGEFGGLDNRRTNLRVASGKDQQGNRRKSSARKSKWKGVYQHLRSGKWDAYIRMNGKTKNLGRFATDEGAARAYDTAALKHFGEFARLNLPTQGAA